MPTREQAGELYEAAKAVLEMRAEDWRQPAPYERTGGNPDLNRLRAALVAYETRGQMFVAEQEPTDDGPPGNRCPQCQQPIQVIYPADLIDEVAKLQRQAAEMITTAAQTLIRATAAILPAAMVTAPAVDPATISGHRHGPDSPPCGYCHSCGTWVGQSTTDCPKCGATDLPDD